MTEKKVPHYLTPEEADKMKCPMKIAATIRYAKCHGPECMAWRWVMFDKTPPHTNALMPRPQFDYEYSTTHGYCGMVRS